MKNNVIIIHGNICLEVFDYKTKESIIILLYSMKNYNSNYKDIKLFNPNFIIELYFEEYLMDILYKLKDINDKVIFNMNVELIIEQIKKKDK